MVLLAMGFHPFELSRDGRKLLSPQLLLLSDLAILVGGLKMSFCAVFANRILRIGSPSLLWRSARSFATHELCNGSAVIMQAFRRSKNRNNLRHHTA
jgi:hypothetical protein